MDVKYQKCTYGTGNAATHLNFGKQSIICCEATQLLPKETEGGLAYF